MQQGGYRPIWTGDAQEEHNNTKMCNWMFQKDERALGTQQTAYRRINKRGL